MKVTYRDKEDFITLPDVSDINKITASDVNQIKKAINTNDAVLTELSETVDNNISNMDKLSESINDNTSNIDELTKTVDNNISNIDKLSESINDNTSNIDELTKTVGMFATVPLGTILQWTGNTVPDKYLKLDGQTLATKEYPDLYALIGNKYGGNNSSFNLPNQNTGADSINASDIPFYYYIIKAK